MSNYGMVQGSFLNQQDKRVPLTGRIVFTPKQAGSDPGVDYPRTRVIGYLNTAGELTDADGSALRLLFGEWTAVFMLRSNGEHVPIPPVSFMLEGDIWLTQKPGATGYEYTVTSVGDGVAIIIGAVTSNGDGTATIYRSTNG